MSQDPHLYTGGNHSVYTRRLDSYSQPVTPSLYRHVCPFLCHVTAQLSHVGSVCVACLLYAWKLRTLLQGPACALSVCSENTFWALLATE